MTCFLVPDRLLCITNKKQKGNNIKMSGMVVRVIWFLSCWDMATNQVGCALWSDLLT